MNVFTNIRRAWHPAARALGVQRSRPKHARRYLIADAKHRGFRLSQVRSEKGDHPCDVVCRWPHIQHRARKLQQVDQGPNHAFVCLQKKRRAKRMDAYQREFGHCRRRKCTRASFAPRMDCKRAHIAYFRVREFGNAGREETFARETFACALI